jgi:hypothetical protein
MDWFDVHVVVIVFSLDFTGRYAYNVYSHFLSSLNGCYIFKMMILAACRCLNDILSIGAYLFTAYFYIPLSFHGLCMKALDVIYV